ncbi:hypothetical protein RB195_024785 [Necator americanus]|uniref:Reverse transcriptase domain-containing protein n=1 Tax=Necator americanus TaxID=51031 RepID=A0ABR1EPN6_NECAM
MEFEKACEDKNPQKAYALLKQYRGKMKRRSPVLNTVNGVAVGEATIPIWREHIKTLLNQQTPSAPELEHVHRPTYAVNKEPPTESEVLVCIQKMNNGKSGGDDGISAEMLKYLPPSGTRVVTKIIRSIWTDERILDSWRNATIIPLHKKLSVTCSRNYRGISCCMPCTRRLLNALCADGVPGKFVRLFDDLNQRTIAAVRTPVGCTTPFEVVTGERQGAVAGPFLFNFAIGDIMRRTVDQCPADIILAPLGHPLIDIEYADVRDSMLLHWREAVRNLLSHVNMLSTLYRSWLQHMDYVCALINAKKCESLRDLERESEWTDNR